MLIEKSAPVPSVFENLGLSGLFATENAPVDSFCAKVVPPEVHDPSALFTLRGAADTTFVCDPSRLRYVVSLDPKLTGTDVFGSNADAFDGTGKVTGGADRVINDAFGPSSAGFPLGAVARPDATGSGLAGCVCPLLEGKPDACGQPA